MESCGSGTLISAQLDPLTQGRRMRPSGQLYSAICTANALALHAVRQPDAGTSNGDIRVSENHRR